MGVAKDTLIIIFVTGNVYMNSNLLSYYSASNTCITQCVLEERIVNKVTHKQ